MYFKLATQLAAGVSLAVALTPAIAGATTILTNGSFESPGGPANTRTELLASGDDTVTGWHNVGGFQIYEATNVDGLPAADGSFYVSFGHSGTTGGQLSQSFDTVLGDIYTVDYQIAIQQVPDQNTSFNVSVTGDSLSTSVNSGAPVYNSWTAGTTLQFTGTGGQVTLTFTDATDPQAGGGNGNLALDNVQVADLGQRVGPQGVPEPDAWALMILGFGGAGAMARARRRLEARGA